MAKIHSADPLPQTVAEEAEEDIAVRVALGIVPVTRPQAAEAEDTRGQWTSWGFFGTFG